MDRKYFVTEETMRKIKKGISDLQNTERELNNLNKRYDSWIESFIEDLTGCDETFLKFIKKQINNILYTRKLKADVRDITYG